MADDQDWRLTAELDAAPHPGVLERLIGRARAPDVVREVGAAVGHDVVITHDGSTLFAYAASEGALRAARTAIETVLARDAISATITTSRFDHELNEWRQVDPPLRGAALRAQQAHERDAERQETRTMVTSSGKLVRSELEQSMLDWAQKLGLRCEINEHPHLLTSQVAFTVSGPRRKLDEFAAGLRAEEHATMRTEGTVMISPL